jgi:hypothetical protein
MNLKTLNNIKNHEKEDILSRVDTTHQIQHIKLRLRQSRNLFKLRNTFRFAILSDWFVPPLLFIRWCSKHRTWLLACTQSEQIRIFLWRRISDCDRSIQVISNMRMILVTKTLHTTNRMMVRILQTFKTCKSWNIACPRFSATQQACMQIFDRGISTISTCDPRLDWLLTIPFNSRCCWAKKNGFRGRLCRCTCRLGFTHRYDASGFRSVTLPGHTSNRNDIAKRLMKKSVVLPFVLSVNLHT